MWEGFLTLDQEEIVNNARAVAGAQAHGLPVHCAPCEGAAAGLDEPPFTGTPSIDQAPWYDPTRPASGRFLGVMGLEVTGYSTSPIAREITELITDGAALSTLRRTERELVYTVALLALDDEAMSYGYEWLAMALRGDNDAACGGADLCAMAACPTSRADGDRKIRYLYNVGLVDPLTEKERRYLSGGGQCDQNPCGDCCDAGALDPLYSTATFTLAAGTPYIFREPIAVDDGAWTDLADGDRLTRYDPDAIDDNCPEPMSCVTDPNCVAPPLPPRVAIPNNPCWPTGAFTARRSWISVSPLHLPQWADLVPLVEVYTGENALRRLIVRFYPNAAGLDCESAGADPCAACSSVNVAYLPARATFLLDGRMQQASVDCSTATQAGAGIPALYGPSGSAFTWPVFDCPTGFCIEVIAEDSTVSSTTQVRVSMVPRGDAG